MVILRSISSNLRISVLLVADSDSSFSEMNDCKFEGMSRSFRSNMAEVRIMGIFDLAKIDSNLTRNRFILKQTGSDK